MTKVKLLIISNERKLRAKYGKEGFLKIVQKLEDLEKIMDNDNVEPYLVFVDNKSSTDQYGLPTVKNTVTESDGTNKEASDIQKLVIRFDTEHCKHRLRDLLIVGGHDIIPFFEVENPVIDILIEGENEYEPYIYSDAPYGSSIEYNDENPLYYLPSWGVGRFPDRSKWSICKSPDPAGDETRILERQIDSAINARNSSNSMGFIGFATWEAMEVSNWMVGTLFGKKTDITKNIYAVTPQLLSHHRYHFYNLHGSPGSDAWDALDEINREYSVVTGTKVKEAEISNSIIFTEACWGAAVTDRSEDKCVSTNALPMKFLEGGAECLVGATTIAFGQSGDSTYMHNADRIFHKFIRMVRKKRMRYGDALARARIEYFANCTSLWKGKSGYKKKRGYLPRPHDKLTLVEFVLYGDPTAR